MSKRNTFDMGVKFRVSFWEDYCQYCPQLARKYGDIVLEVEYEPTGKYGIDNYGFNPPPGEEVWQFSVFVKIPICFVKVIVNNKEELKAQEEE